MYYPNNFPRHLEDPILMLLTMLRDDFRNGVIADQKKFNRQFLNHLKLADLNRHFMDEKPAHWWLNFVLLRHDSLFEKDFVAHISPFLTKTKTRSLSGIVPLSLFTSGTGCPFNCIYCPNEPGVPKSYFSDEPAVMRAIRHEFDPYTQTLNRLVMFVLSGHPIDKVEVIIKGGTFSFYEAAYRRHFVKRIFDACNTDVLSYIKTGTLQKKSSATLSQAQRKNESSRSRVIGINIETRPDFINPKELILLRHLGVTHVEIGVQALDDTIYRLIRRGHTVNDVINATKQLRDAGFKVGYHLMPNLPGSNPEHDFALLKKAFDDEAFKPDHLKLYPTTVTRHTILSEWFKSGKYRPYGNTELADVIIRFKSQVVPNWVRIGRLTRDITTTVMEGSGIAPNMREMLQKTMEDKHIRCKCIRCREIKNHTVSGIPVLKVSPYQASGAMEYFLEYADKENRLLGFLRLRIPAQNTKDSKPLFPSLVASAIVRELHVYGQAVEIGKSGTDTIQHRSIGRRLLEEAEKLARCHKVGRICVIAGIGTRQYYGKSGYSLKDTYMVKDIIP